MNKKWNNFKYSLSKFPIRPNLILILGMIAILYFLVFNTKNPQEDNSINSFKPILILLSKVGLIVLISLLVLSVLSTFISFFIFKYRKRNKKSTFQLNLEKKDEDNILSIRPTLQKGLRPLLGYISGALLLKDKQLSHAFVLASTLYKKNSLQSDALYGGAMLHFPDIKAYQVEGTLLYFEDMFRLIRLTVKEPINEHFYNPPQYLHSDELPVQPEATNDMDVRIEQLRKVEGELLNYKQFEYGDDVRRIVWKIYGKNRELVVRKPETQNPFASKIEMYASFHTNFSELTLDNKVAQSMLNSYKNAVWSLYKSLASKQEWDLEFVSEHLSNVKSDQKEEKIAMQIADANWQHQKDILQYFNLKKGSVFCIHSLTDATALETFLENGGANKFIYMAYLSDAFASQNKNWLKKIFFFEPSEQSENTSYTEWLLSPLKAKVLKNEALLSRILKSYGFE